MPKSEAETQQRHVFTLPDGTVMDVSVDVDGKLNVKSTSSNHMLSVEPNADNSISIVRR
jgi:hypothetical protein